MFSCKWLVDGCPTPTDTSSHPGKVKLSYFYGLEKHRRVGILNQIMQDTATKLFKNSENQPDPCLYAFMVWNTDNFTFLL
jgi:hypothetical protein